MRVINSIGEMRSLSREIRAQGRSLALVPTMGALHEGHLRLVREAKGHCDAVVVSIFVNPMQFGPQEDLSRYPRNLERDLELLGPFKVDAAFAPAATEMYPEGFETFVEPGNTAASLEGAARPGHFRGVATVVLKLFNIVRPDVAYFGQKDFQQAIVIRRLIQNLNLDVRLVLCPIVRELNGLAKSSRNVYLTTEERKAALALYRALKRAEELAQAGTTEVGTILEEIRKIFAAEPRVQLEYGVIVGPAQFQPVERVTPGCVALVAARVGAARLIDNLILGPAGASDDDLLQVALSAQPVIDIQARIPGLETENLKRRIESCRDCAAISSILLPPREFLTKYLKLEYADLNAVGVAVIARDAPFNPENFLYRKPGTADRFAAGLYELLGVKDLTEFKTRFILTDAIRCHAIVSRVPTKALEYCSKHLVEELQLFPNLKTIVVLGEDAYLQFQQILLRRTAAEIKPWEDVLKERDWARQEVRVPALGERVLTVFYCYHPILGYKRSPSIAGMLE